MGSIKSMKTYFAISIDILYFFQAFLTRSAADGFGRPLSPSSPPPEHRVSRPISYIRPPGKHIIPSNSISINKTLGEGEFGVVQQGIWTTEEGEKV